MDENLTYTKVGEVEICILVYNDPETYKYLEVNYTEHLSDGRLVISHRGDDKPFSCGYVKNFAHDLGKGEILFNLDADNFIDTPHQALLLLKENEILRHVGGQDVGLSGRIGVYRKHYLTVKGYRDVGRQDDGDFIRRLLWESGEKMTLVSHQTFKLSIDNPR